MRKRSKYAPLEVTETRKCDFCDTDYPYGHNHWHNLRRIPGSVAMICKGCDSYDGMVATNDAEAAFIRFGIPIRYLANRCLVIPR